MIRTIDATAAKRLVHGPGELAFLDIREAGEFGEGHPLFAAPLPYSRLELDAPALVPNPNVPLLLIDGGDGVAERAARRLAALGYSDIAIVAGGAPAWAAAGFTLFKGVNLPGKTLGELAEAAWHPPMITAETLADWRAAGRSFQLFDVRPPGEHAKMRVPGARCLPNGELPHRLPAAIADPDAPVVVACAGRTRGIIGVLGLKLAGVDGDVYALENGTQGWVLAGLELERGNEAEPFPELDPAARQLSAERARAVAERWSLPWIDAEGFRQLAADESRSLYLLDVRDAADRAAEPIPGAVHAPAGQLVQAVDQWVAIRRARIVLADDTGLRAAIAAFWLRQLGFETYILPGAPTAVERDALAARAAPMEPHLKLPGTITPQQAGEDARAGRAALLDLRPSRLYRQGHAAGSIWSRRPRLAAALERRPATVRLIADDAEMLALAAADLAELGVDDVRVVEGGLTGWREAGLPVEVTPDQPADAEMVDFLWFVHDRHDGNLESSRQYLAWEQGLVGQLDADERAEFQLTVAWQAVEKGIWA
ncbi:MAG TPA: rhodanese-like domain-containing protein [Afifellaceae bacterium]|nr:rhodanese-like domain-containing protein [Afifellaceae bacterium]